MGAKGINIAPSSSSNPLPDFYTETWEVTEGMGDTEFGQAQIWLPQQRVFLQSLGKGKEKVLQGPTAAFVSVQNQRDL